MIGEWFFEAFGRAMDDVRKNLVERGWRGREFDGNGGWDRETATANPSIAQQMGWDQPGEFRQPPGHEHEHGIDR
ncbi:hypothetical protein [Novosphingobium naphthalenivorans]|uniref:hypothetical protein n=1 Tax=Novosphingobium naphthalenivorans TaxID=273168 RepID=UPI00082A572D|nr:hypothetical protein [Novosphingobium naphthalenivorans]